MSQFEPEPLITLLTMEEVHKALSESKDAPFGLVGLDRYKIKSLWLIELIDEIVSTGSYPYNATVKRLAESRLGFPPKRDAAQSVQRGFVEIGPSEGRGVEPAVARDELLTEPLLMLRGSDFHEEGMVTPACRMKRRAKRIRCGTRLGRSRRAS